MAAAALEGEWELCNDDGFVYKRKKRRQDSTSAAPESAPAPDLEAEERQRRERRKRTLMKLRDGYRKEIDRWDCLSNRLREMEERTRQQKQQPPSIISSVESPSPTVDESESDCRPFIEAILLQVEAREKIIQSISNLCEAAEEMGKAQEERLKQFFFNLPVWDTPRTLMACLSDE